MAIELSKQNEAQNAITAAKKEKLDAEIKKEITKLAKAQARSKINIQDTNYWRWKKSDTASVSFDVDLTPKVSEMIIEHERMTILSTDPEILHQKIKARIHEEMISMIAEQPGMKDVMNSTLRAIGLAK